MRCKIAFSFADELGEDFFNRLVRFLRILLASSLELVLDAVSGMEDETASSTVGFASSPSCG
jgi:hypothetical protein